MIENRKVSLAGFTTFGIGGEAEVCILTKPSDCSRLAKERVVLGNGSNVLISDRGVPVPVYLDRMTAYSITGTTLKAQSGCLLSALALQTAQMGLSGLEWAYGLPARVGGAVVMNAGAFGGQTSDSLQAVYGCFSGERSRLGKPECGFGYRVSRFGEEDVVTEAEFLLKREDKQVCLNRIRRVKQARQAQPKGKSAGCMYKTDGKSAGWYIDRAGLKGKRIGDIMVSPVHAGFFINVGRGRASDVVRLMDTVEKTVQDVFGVTLAREIRLIGEF